MCPPFTPANCRTQIWKHSQTYRQPIEGKWNRSGKKCKIVAFVIEQIRIFIQIWYFKKFINVKLKKNHWAKYNRWKWQSHNSRNYLTCELVTKPAYWKIREVGKFSSQSSARESSKKNARAKASGKISLQCWPAESWRRTSERRKTGANYGSSAKRFALDKIVICILVSLILSCKGPPRTRYRSDDFWHLRDIVLLEERGRNCVFASFFLLLNILLSIFIEALISF